jgi:NAD+ kinase
VLEPTLGAFVIVPIAAHTLSARPLVVPDSEKITVCAGDNYVVSADGQEFYEFSGEMVIEKSPSSAKLALLDDTEFYPILRDKLHWGISPAKC